MDIPHPGSDAVGPGGVLGGWVYPVGYWVWVGRVCTVNGWVFDL